MKARTLFTEAHRAALIEDGFTVVPGVLSEWDALYQGRKIEEELKLMSANNWPAFRPFNPHGIVQCPQEIIHTERVRFNRYENIDLLKVWCDLFRADTLVGSCDRINYQCSSAQACAEQSAKKPRRVQPWWHVDQTPRDGLTPFAARESAAASIQGYIDLFGTLSEREGGLMVLKGSHKTSQARIDPKEVKKLGWYSFKEKAAQFEAEFEVVHVRCAPGDLVLWDSRVIHQSMLHCSEEAPRLVIYNAFLPAHAVKKNLFAKKRVFEERRATTHTPGAQRLFGKVPQTYGAELPPICLDEAVFGWGRKGEYQDRVTSAPKSLKSILGE
jgi:hypothetical protein